MIKWYGILMWKWYNDQMWYDNDNVVKIKLVMIMMTMWIMWNDIIYDDMMHMMKIYTKQKLRSMLAKHWPQNY